MSLPVDLQKTGTFHLMFVFKMRDCEGNLLGVALTDMLKEI